MRSLISVSEMGRQLGVGKTTAWKIVREKNVECVRIGRRTLVRWDSINRFIDQCSAKSDTQN